MELTRKMSRSILLSITYLVFNLIANQARCLDGVVVEKLTRASEAAASGIKAGDELRSWSRGGSSGAVESPFALLKLEIEQAPLGAVTLEGVGAAEPQRWQLGQDAWEVTTRPNFKPSELKLLNQSRQFLLQGNIASARARWRLIASRERNLPWVYSWCAWDAAQVMAEQHRWSAADRLFSEAVDNAGSEPLVRALLLHGWGIALEQTGQWNRVHDLLQQSVSTAEKVAPDSLPLAYLLDELGVVTNWQRHSTEANDIYLRALAIQKRLAPESLATEHSLIGLSIQARGRADDKTDEAFLNQAKPIVEKISPAGVDAAILKASFGHIAERRGDFAAAKQYSNEAEAILEPRWQGTLVQARVLNGVAFIALRQGDLVNAELLLHRIVDIYHAKPADPSLGIFVTNELGILAFESGDFETATRYARDTNNILKSIAPVSMERGGCLLNLGMYAYSDGDLRTAQSYAAQSLAIMEKLVPNKSEHAQVLSFLSTLSRQQGDYHQAFEYATKAHDIMTQIGIHGFLEAVLLEELAEISKHEGSLKASEDYYRRAIEFAEKEFPSTLGHEELLAGLADLMVEEDNQESAAKYYQLAVDALESQISRLGGTQDVRSEFRAQHVLVYKHYLELLVNSGKPEQAFELLERSRARTLLEMLADANVDLRKHADPVLMQQEHTLQREFAGESDRRLRLMADPHTSAEDIRAEDVKIKSLLNKHSELESRIRDTNPAYAELTQPQHVSIQDVQRNLLDSDSALLEYSLDDEHSYVWLVTNDSVSVYDLPERNKIEDLARRVHQAMSGLRMAKKSSDSEMPALALAHMVLGPVSNQLKSKTRILVVADGALNYVPFTALPIPDEGLTKRSLMVTRHEVVNLPSASALITMRKEHAGRQSFTGEVAVLADPVFAVSDPRVHQRGASRAGSHPLTSSAESFAASRSVDLTQRRWTRDLGSKSGSFPRLVYSRQEARSIAATVPEQKSLEALDFKASRIQAMSPNLANYRILHFATHGILDTRHPEFSGLLFSLVDEHGAPQIGLLSLEDIYSLNLPVDMVVLSACDSALGKEVNGEGIVGITRGFIYAGASRVVASLWKVNDVATSQLMADFYSAMEKEHLPASAALRKAQIQMQKSTKWSAPYYWAAFQLQGEWN